MKQKVYLVIEYNPSARIVGVYATRELAEEHVVNSVYKETSRGTKSPERSILRKSVRG